ncbi:magnesium transporter MgtE N-terminal domain-containing protein [Actinomadura alba]|uniref:Magnesium transporter n=1 Tax=Actinomadura alba TaxID=406431 RepID=A0ABR7M0X7_9ACTN|nr:CBS domain-containing protein [Actinomadura alba]MBC6470694.1 magnesium transporter [Actinomadura alba]
MTGFPARVFIARLAGVAVFDPAGDQVGRVRDVVVALRDGVKPPRVLGLVIEVQPRRSVFLPITRVTTIDADAIIFDGRLNVRRFQQRASETLVIGEVLDHTVELIEDGETVSVVDVAMEQSRNREWLVTKVAVQRGGRAMGGRRARLGLRRRGETFVVDSAAVRGLTVVEEGQGAQNLLAIFERTKPADIAGILHELPAKRRSEVAVALDDERLADVLEELPRSDQVAIVGGIDPDRAADVLDVMDPDAAADLLGELPAEQRERLLALMEPKEAAPVRRLLSYPDDTAGGMMTTDPVTVPPDATVAEALAQIRNPDLNPALAAQVYVCRPPVETPTGRYLGPVHFQRLLREPPSSLVSGILDTELAPLRPALSLTTVASYLATYNLVSVAIVNEAGQLIGAVTVDDVLDHMLPEDWRENVMESDTDETGDPEEEAVRSES